MSGRSKLLALRNKVSKSIERTQKVKAEVEAKRASKKVVHEKVPEKKDLLDKMGQVQVSRTVVRRKVNATAVEGWFKDGIRKLYGDNFVIPYWTVKQKTLAKRLLGIYGEDLVRDAVEHYCSNWPKMVQESRGRIKGAPTINLLWSIREWMFAEVQEAGKANAQLSPKNSDEFIEEEKSPTIGW